MKNSGFLIILFALATSSCRKEPGEGGNAFIKGRVLVEDWDYDSTKNEWFLNKSFYAPDERVYIIYGDNDVYNDDFDTDPNGYYIFRWLRKGDYTLFAYSKDILPNTNTPSGLVPVYINVEITKRKEELEAPDIVIVR